MIEGTKMSETYDEKKENIKKSALQVFIKYGYNKTTMDDIAENVGIKKNSLYYYFPNKESLFEEIVQEELGRMLNHVKGAVDNVGSVEEKIKIFFKEFQCYGRKTKAEYPVSIEKMIEFSQVIEENFSKYFNNVREMLKDILDQGCKSGEIKKINTNEVSALIIKFITSYQREEFRNTKNKVFTDVEFKKIDSEVNGILTLIINGLK